MKPKKHLHKKNDVTVIVFSVFVLISLAIGIILTASAILILGKAI